MVNLSCNPPVRTLASHVRVIWAFLLVLDPDSGFLYTLVGSHAIIAESFPPVSEIWIAFLIPGPVLCPDTSVGLKLAEGSFVSLHLSPMHNICQRGLVKEVLNSPIIEFKSIRL